jgi:DNA-binding MarR family transcriptional regulator
MASNKKIGPPKTMRALSLWHGVTSAALQKMPVDLSARQTAVLLQTYLLPPPHSIKGLADELMISKPAICRAIDVLEAARLVRRVGDKQDGRNVLLARTAKGSAYLSEFAGIILGVSKASA